MLKKRFYIHTFGCQMNVHDSEQMAAYLIQEGHVPVDCPEMADIILVNTCSIRHKAENKAYSQIGRFRKYKEGRPGLILGVVGCLAQHRGRHFLKHAPYVDLIVGTHNIHLVPQMIQAAAERQTSIIETRFHDHVESIDVFTKPPEGAVSAFVTVMQGCNNFCAYCVVPYLRGREESRRKDRILAEIGQLAGYGIKEVTLLGQNVNSYGKTLESGETFAGLLRSIGEIEGIERVRFTTSHPKDLTDDIIEAFGDVRSLCEHIHLPVQSGSDRILEKMNRRYTADDYLKKVDKLRKVCSNISITTDIIVGFPGEGKDDFNATVNLMKEVRFDTLFSFNYSDRAGTAATAFNEKVDDAVKSERLMIVQDLQKIHTMEKHQSMEGGAEEILVEGRSKNSVKDMTGRTRTNKIVNFEGGTELIGKRVSVHIEKAFLHSLRGTLCVPKEDVVS